MQAIAHNLEKETWKKKISAKIVDTSENEGNKDGTSIWDYDLPHKQISVGNVLYCTESHLVVSTNLFL